MIPLVAITQDACSPTFADPLSFPPFPIEAMKLVVVAVPVRTSPVAVFAATAEFSPRVDSASGITRIAWRTHSDVGVGIKFRNTRMVTGTEAFRSGEAQ